MDWKGGSTRTNSCCCCFCFWTHHLTTQAENLLDWTKNQTNLFCCSLPLSLMFSNPYASTQLVFKWTKIIIWLFWQKVLFIYYSENVWTLKVWGNGFCHKRTMWEECRLFNFRVIGEEKGYIRVVSNFMKTTGKSDRLCSRLFFVPTCLALAFFSRASAGLLRVPIGLFFFFRESWIFSLASNPSGRWERRRSELPNLFESLLWFFKLL